MKTAIISLTVQGARLAQSVRTELVGEVTCYEKEGRHSGGEAVPFAKMGPLMERLFGTVDRILCIMSTGIVVRVIAPLLVHKSQDPAILVMDERAQHVISLLSGHLGGANEWTAEIAQITGADPVITTATDVNGIVAPDVLARKLHWKVEDFSALVAINSALVNGNPVHYYIDAELDHVAAYFEAVAQESLPVHLIEERDGMFYVDAGPCHFVNEEFRVVVTDKLWNFPGETLFLRPPTIVVGMGCRRDTEESMLRYALEEACKMYGRARKSVFAAASVSVKADEEGLLDLMDHIQIPIYFYSQEEMAPQIAEAQLAESDFVKNTIGVGNVCETTAMLLGQSQRFIAQKTVYPRTTVALVKADWSLSALAQVMRTR